jgi:hypothetical protein
MASMAVRVTGCGGAAVAPSLELAAGRLEKLLSAKPGDIKAYGAPKGITLELQAAGAAWPAPKECIYGRVPLSLAAGEARTYTRRGAPRGRACLSELGFSCAAPVQLKARVRARAGNSTRAYAPGPWSADVTFTPTCEPAAAACPKL